MGRIRLSAEARLDLHWFEHILVHGRLRSVPLRLFADLPPADVHIDMDASDLGLCPLHPARREFIQLEFDQEERRLIRENKFSINVREQLSAVLAVLFWSAPWIPHTSDDLAHVRLWIDNQSAVSWCNNLQSRDKMAQEFNRIIGAVEAQWGLHVSAGHLPGATNTLADLGSRASDGDGTRHQQWQILTRAWSLINVLLRIRKIYSATSSPFRADPSLNRHNASTRARGTSGTTSAPVWASRSGFPKTTAGINSYSWLSSPFTAGRVDYPVVKSHQRPFDQNLATSAGIISSTPASTRCSSQVTLSLSPDCTEPAHHLSQGQPPPDQCFSGSSPNSTSRPQYRVIAGAAMLGFFFLR